MITVTIMKKENKKRRWEYLKTWLGIFRVGGFWVWIFWSGNSSGGSLMGRNFSGESFPDAHINRQLCFF